MIKKMIKNLLLSTCLLIGITAVGTGLRATITAGAMSALPVPTPTPSSVVVKRFGSTVNDAGNAVAFDSSGNLYMTGYFTGTVDFGGTSLTSNGASFPDIFLAKYTSAGTLLWAKRFGGTVDDAGYGVVVDSSSNVIVAGYFAGTADFGGGNLTATGGYDIFIAKYNSAGTYQWASRYGGTLSDIANALAVDSSGNVAITGSFQGTVNFGGGNIVASGSFPNVYVAKFSSAGAHVFSRGIGSGVGVSDRGQGVAFDSSGNVIIAGHFADTANFGGGAITSAGGEDVFVAKYASAGTFTWVKQFGDPVDQEGMAVAVDSGANVCISGFFKGTLVFGGTTLTNTNFVQPDIFMAKLNSSGTSVWAKSFGSTSADQSRGIAVDTSDNVIITGFFTGTVNFGGGAFTSNGLNTFVASYSSAGVHEWSRFFLGSASNNGLGVAADANGNVSLTGWFQGTADFGTGPTVSAGGLDIFLVNEILVAPTPTPTPTPTPPSASISGTLSYCASASPIGMPNVTMNLTGSASQVTVTDASGNYTFSAVPTGGSYTITPVKSGAVSGINTVDASRIQGFIAGTFSLTACQQLAADVNQDGFITNADVSDILNYIAGNPVIGNHTGEWRFNPGSKSYNNLSTNQTAQNYNVMLLGEVSGNWIFSSAGADQSIPTGSAVLAGAADTDSGSLTYTWSKVSGPNVPVVTSPTSLSTSTTGLISGTYVFRLAVNNGQTTITDDAQVVTSFAVELPVCRPNQVVGSPVVCRCLTRVIGNPPRCK